MTLQIKYEKRLEVTYYSTYDDGVGAICHQLVERELGNPAADGVAPGMGDLLGEEVSTNKA